MSSSILALELCLRLEPGSPLRSELHQLVATHPSTSSPGLKWQLLRRVSELLAASEHLFELGCWDFFDDDERARADFEMWSNGMITEEGARTEPSGEPHPPGQQRYMTFTVAILLEQGSECERYLAQLCETPQDQLWDRAAFLKVIQGLVYVNYAFVKADVLYVIPGDESWGLTQEDLDAKKFDYLRPIRN